MLVLLIVAAAVALQLYFKTRSETHVDSSASVVEANKLELTNLVELVGKLIILPTGEEPTLATVSDPEKLKDQAFFKNAVLGDKVLIYAAAKKAILYSPSRGKIIEVAPVNLNAPQPNSTQLPLSTSTPNPTPNPKQPQNQKKPATQTGTPSQTNQ